MTKNTYFRFQHFDLDLDLEAPHLAACLALDGGLTGAALTGLGPGKERGASPLQQRPFARTRLYDAPAEADVAVAVH